MATSSNNIGQNRVRVVGGGFTIFTFGGQPITFCQQVGYQSPQPVGNGFSAIQPMDEPYAVEILTPIAAGPGTLTLNMFELFGSGGAASKIWDRLGAAVGTTGDPFSGSASNGYQDDVSTWLANLSAKTNPFAGAVDIVDIFIRQAQLTPAAMQIVKVVRPLPLPGQTGSQAYTEEYVGCKITNVSDNETDEVGTMEVVKQVTVMYRYVTRNGKPSAAFQLRDASLA
jgi:hypothetical protein